MSEGLTLCGINNNLNDDGIVIQGGKISGSIIDSKGDHRVAMAFSIAGLVSSENITILNTKNVSTSFPDFHNLMKALGLNIRREIS